MSNNFLTPSIIAREALMILQANMVMAGLVYRAYEKEFGPTKVGNTVTIPSPATFEAKEFTTSIEIQNANELGVSLTLEKHFDVSLAVTSVDWTLKLGRLFPADRGPGHGRHCPGHRRLHAFQICRRL